MTLESPASQVRRRPRFDWRSDGLRLLFIIAGCLISAVSVIVFLAPFDIAPAGVTGLAVILNITLGTPIGLVVLLGNIPIQIAAARMLGGWRSVMWTVFAVALFSVMVDVLEPFFPPQGVSENVLLNALFGGVLGGAGAGIIYRVGANLGGTSTLARILQIRFGMPLSNTYLYSNLVIVFLAGLVFGWEGALYAIVTLAVEGAVSDYLLEGPSVIRTAVIITGRPQEVADVILYQLQRGVTGWEATGMFTGQKRHMLYVTVSRFQINTLRQLVVEADPGAFIVVGQGHVAYGEGFLRPVPSPLEPK